MTMISKGTGWTCPACGQEIQGQFALEIDVASLEFPRPETAEPSPKGFVSQMTLTGVRISHDCIPTRVRGQDLGPGNAEDQVRRDILADPDRLARARAQAEASGVDPDATLPEPDPDLVGSDPVAARAEIESGLPKGMKVYGNPRDPDPYGGHQAQRDALLQ